MKTPRQTQPFRWGALAATVTLAASPSLAAFPALGVQNMPRITLATPNFWLAQDQGGEAGEAGITANASTDAAYLAELAIIEGHMLAARDLYAKGLKDEGVALSRHPQEEGTLDALRKDIAAHDAADPSDAVNAFAAAMVAGSDQAAVDAALAAVSDVFAAAAAVEDDKVRARFDAVVLLLKAAAGEYEASIENGSVTDVMGWHEAFSFTAIARRNLSDLAAVEPSAKAANKAIAALIGTDAAFGDPTATPPLAGDAQILLTVAARVELIASSVR